MYRITILLLAIALAIPSVADGQINEMVVVGQRVRVNSLLGHLHPQTTVGSVAIVTDDSLYVQPRDSDSVVGLEGREVTGLEVSMGRSSYTVAGLFLGAGAGLAIGLMARPAPKEPPDCTPQGGDIAPFDAMLGMFCSAGAGAANGVERAVAPVIGTLLGSALGALIGSSIKTEHWVPAVVPARTDAGTSLGLSWSVPTAR